MEKKTKYFTEELYWPHFLFICFHLDSNLMCNRKLPPSFWISDYQPPRPSFGTHTNQDFSRDLYSASSWYNWPYHFPSSSYPNSSELSRSFPYSSFDPMGKLSPSYQSLMLRSGLEARNSKFDRAKIPDPLSGSSYYGLSRLGADLQNSKIGRASCRERV